MNRWDLTLAGLRREPWPALPELPGRVVMAYDEPLVLTDDERAELLASDETDATVGLLLGLTRARVGQLRATAQQVRVQGEEESPGGPGEIGGGLHPKPPPTAGAGRTG